MDTEMWVSVHEHKYAQNTGHMFELFLQKVVDKLNYTKHYNAKNLMHKSILSFYSAVHLLPPKAKKRNPQAAVYSRSKHEARNEIFFLSVGIGKEKNRTGN